MFMLRRPRPPRPPPRRSSPVSAFGRGIRLKASIISPLLLIQMGAARAGVDGLGWESLVRGPAEKVNYTCLLYTSRCV